MNKEGIIFLILFIGIALALAISLPFSLIANTTYIIEDATKDQIITLTHGDDDSGVHYVRSNLLEQGSSLIEITFQTKWYEQYNATRFLKDTGVKYYKIDQVSGR